MICVNCQAVINPEWKSCIQRNSCPGCGEAIYTEEVKELILELKNALEKMPNDPEGLAGWLTTHYHMKKIGTAEPTAQFHSAKPKRQEEYSSNEDVDVNQRIASEKAKLFNKNAQVPNIKKLENIAKKIKESGAETIDLSTVSEDEIEQSDLSSSFSTEDPEMASLENMMVNIKKDPTANAKDLRALEAQKLKALQGRQKLLEGGGPFTRSS